jgi:hypothetical protein
MGERCPAAGAAAHISTSSSNGSKVPCPRTCSAARAALHPNVCALTMCAGSAGEPCKRFASGLHTLRPSAWGRPHPRNYCSVASTSPSTCVHDTLLSPYYLCLAVHARCPGRRAQQHPAENPGAAAAAAAAAGAGVAAAGVAAGGVTRRRTLAAAAAVAAAAGMVVGMM